MQLYLSLVVPVGTGSFNSRVVTVVDFENHGLDSIDAESSWFEPRLGHDIICSGSESLLSVTG